MDPADRAEFDSALPRYQRWASEALDPSKVKTEEEGNFCHIALALCLASQCNYLEMQTAYDAQDQPKMAWACRNLLEIAIYMKFVLQSKRNADDFAADRLIDSLDIGIALKKIYSELHPKLDDPDLEATLKLVKKQMAAESVTRTEYLRVSALAKKVGLQTEYENMNRLCSKFVHPTPWSLFTADKGPERFPSASDIFYSYGAKYLAIVFAEIKSHVKKYGLHHKPKS